MRARAATRGGDDYVNGGAMRVPPEGGVLPPPFLGVPREFPEQTDPNSTWYSIWCLWKFVQSKRPWGLVQ